MKSVEIYHRGRVVENRGKVVSVELERGRETDCGACAMASVCGSGNDSLVVEAALPKGMSTQAGEYVRVAAGGKSRRAANVLLLILPTIGFVGGIVAALYAGCSEPAALGVGVLGCSACFVAVALAVGRRKPVWKVVKIEN